MEFVLIGKIINTHGIKGEVKVESFTDFAEKRFLKGSSVYLGEKKQELKVNSFRLHQSFILVSFDNYLDINLVEKFKNQNLYKCTADIEALKAGEYYFKDLRGLQVVVDKQVIGSVIRVEEGNKYNYLRIEVDSKEKLVPYIPTFVKNVDLAKQQIEIIKMEGLL